MKNWLAATCPVCGFRYPLKKFSCQLRPIDFPFQIVTGGGRARGFKVQQYLPWSALPEIKTQAWNSILSIYSRLGAAYDNYYEFLGFLSPKMGALVQRYQSYADIYSIKTTPEYSRLYTNATSNDFTEAYNHADYTDAYAYLLLTGGMPSE